MNEAQVWALIGVFSTALFATITFSTQVMWRSINARFDSLRDEMRTGFTSLRTETAAQFDAVRAETAALRSETTTQFDAVRTQISHLDRDVQAISRRVFPE